MLVQSLLIRRGRGSGGRSSGGNTVCSVFLALRRSYISPTILRE
jgi:hypothetical protein